MGAKKYPIRLSGFIKVASTGTGKVTTRMVKDGEVVACQSIAFRNRTGTRGTVTLQLKQGEAVFPFADQSSPTSNRWWYYPYTQHLVAGERIEAEQASCSADDLLDLKVIGYVVYGSGGEVP